MRMDIPESILRKIAGKEYVCDDIGRSGSSVLMFEDMVLKIETESEEARRAAAMMQWLEGRIPAPELLEWTTCGGMSYTLMTRVRGEMACVPRYMERPKKLAKLLAHGLRMLWETEASECPVKNGLNEKLALARMRVEQGLVDVEDAEPGTFSPGGFASPRELLIWLEENRPEEEMVLSHGDFCLPNIYLKDGCVSGFVDLGRSGAADKWQDIALCWRSLMANADGTYGCRYGGYDRSLLFDELGIEPDWEKVRYFILLDELF